VNSLDKQRIARSFSRSAGTYDAHSTLQKELAKELVELVRSLRIRPSAILDIGTGTGEVASLLNKLFPEARISGCDIAPGMVKKAIQQHPGEMFQFDIADAEALPYPDKKFDLVASSTTYQWINDLPKAFGEARRVLADKGTFAFLTFGPKTLTELKRCYRISVDRNANYLHDYRNSRQVHAMLKKIGFRNIKVSSRVVTRLYPDFRTFLRSLKGIGALNASHNLPRGLMGKSKMAELIKTYEANCKMGNNVYASFEVITAVCGK